MIIIIIVFNSKDLHIIMETTFTERIINFDCSQLSAKYWSITKTHHFIA